MIKKKITVAFSAILLLISTFINAQDKEKLEFRKERSVSKTYPAAGNNLSIENTFGHVNIIAWDKNEIKIDVNILVESSNKENAEQIFDNIEIKEDQNGNDIRFKTNHKSQKDNSCHNCRTNMKITYEVHLPVTVKLSIENTFGNIDVPDYKGQISLESKFGNLTAGVLSDVKYLKAEFGKVQIKGVTDISAIFKFSKVQLENLSGANKLSMEFCDSSKLVLNNNLTELTLSESYSTINLRPAGNLGASYIITTNFGNFIDRSEIGMARTNQPERYGPDAKKLYEGKSGNGTAKISVYSSFGKIILGEPKPEDMKKTTKTSGKHAGKVI